MAIKDLQARQSKVDITVNVVELSEPRDFTKFDKPGRVATAIVSDDTGTVKLALWNEEIDKVKSILDAHQNEGVRYHALRSRQAAARKFMVVHLLVPGDWTVRQGHQLAEQVETEIIKAIPLSNIATHIEPVEDPLSEQDIHLDRG